MSSIALKALKKENGELMTYYLKCNTCKQEFDPAMLIESIQQASNDMLQVRGECPYCRNWVKFIPYADSKHVKNVLKLYFNNDYKALEELRKEVIYIDRKEEIK